jgi:hypothetical protein
MGYPRFECADVAGDGRIERLHPAGRTQEDRPHAQRPMRLDRSSTADYSALHQIFTKNHHRSPNGIRQVEVTQAV